MVSQELRDFINDNYGSDIIILDNPSFDNSIIGMDYSEQRLIYSLPKMIKEFAEEANVSDEEADEFIAYNTARAVPYMGSNHPIIYVPGPMATLFNREEN